MGCVCALLSHHDGLWLAKVVRHHFLPLNSHKVVMNWQDGFRLVLFEGKNGLELLFSLNFWLSSVTNRRLITCKFGLALKRIFELQRFVILKHRGEVVWSIASSCLEFLVLDYLRRALKRSASVFLDDLRATSDRTGKQSIGVVLLEVLMLVQVH